MAANAMQKLPVGFPKVMATTVASGTRKFDLVVGDKDITVMPAICDFTGLNLSLIHIYAGNIDRCSDFGTCGSVTSWSLLPEPLKTYAETASGLPGNRHSLFFYYERDTGVKTGKHSAETSESG